MARPRRAVSALTVILLALLGMPVAPAEAAEPPEGIDEPAAWIVVDASTGKVLRAHNEHEPLPPASLAKVMTALVAVERLPDDAKIEISEKAVLQPASKLGAVVGEKYRLDDALAAIMLVSANDMAYAVAETVGTDLAGFADLLNETAARYGMKDSELSDPAGLDDEDSFEGGPRMSAYDVAISIRNAQFALPVARWAAATDYAFDGPSARFELQNHNQMLKGGERETEGVNGFKTGGTNLAGNTLAATATRGNRTLITVVMNTPDTYAWTQYLLDLGFETPAGGDPATGEVLPLPEVSVRAARERDRDEFLALVSGQPVGSITSTSEAGTNVTPFVTSSPTSASSSRASAATEAGRVSGGSGNSMTPLLLVLSIGLSVAFVGRREQVKRRKRRRAQARRERAAMMRRGSLPVVDGRYRTGTRTGNPPQSHIRVRRVDSPQDGDWEEWSGWDDEPPGERR
jgi:D-alanyl-D-alanine carboxypeptidase